MGISFASSKNITEENRAVTTGKTLQKLGLIKPEEPVFEVGLDLELIKKFDAVNKLISMTPMEHLASLQIHVLDLLSEIHRVKSQNISSGFDDKIIDKATRLIMENPINGILLPELLQNIGMSYSRIRSIFKEKLGISPGNYRIQLRIERACSLLLRKDLSISEIAYQLGYKDSFAFSTQFKKIMEMTPSQFRNIN